MLQILQMRKMLQMWADNIRPYKFATVGADIIRPFFSTTFIFSTTFVFSASCAFFYITIVLFYRPKILRATSGTSVIIAATPVFATSRISTVSFTV